MNRIVITIPLRPECIVAARLSAGSVAKILNLGIDDAEDLKLVTNEGCGILFAQKFEDCEVCFDWTEGLEVTFRGLAGTPEYSASVCTIRWANPLYSIPSYMRPNTRAVSLMDSFLPT